MDRWNWLILACCTLFVGVMLVPTGAYVGVWRLASGPNAADWAQFVGGVLAVGVAIWAAWHAGRQTRLMAKAETIRSVELLCSLAYQMVDLVQASWNTLKAHEPLAAENFTSILSLYERFPFDRYPSGEMALRLANIHRLAVRYADDYEGIVSTQATRVPKSMLELVERIDGEYEHLLLSARRTLDALPGRRHVLGGVFSDYSQAMR